MPSEPTKLAAITMAGCLYWYGVCRVAGVTEPWDAAAYWHAWYPLALLLSAIAGAILRRHRWLGGAIVILAQAPVMALTTGIGPFWPAGLLILSVIAIPAMVIATLTGRRNPPPPGGVGRR